MTPYEVGFISKCAECGVPADRVPELLKYAADAIRPAGATGKPFMHRSNPSAYAFSADATKAPIGPYGPTSVRAEGGGTTLRRNDGTHAAPAQAAPGNDAFRRSVLTAMQGGRSLDSLTRAGSLVHGLVPTARPTAATAIAATSENPAVRAGS